MFLKEILDIAASCGIKHQEQGVNLGTASFEGPQSSWHTFAGKMMQLCSNELNKGYFEVIPDDVEQLRNKMNYLSRDTECPEESIDVQAIQDLMESTGIVCVVPSPAQQESVYKGSGLNVANFTSMLMEYCALLCEIHGDEYNALSDKYLILNKIRDDIRNLKPADGLTEEAIPLQTELSRATRPTIKA